MPETETETVKPAEGEKSSRFFSGPLLWTFGAVVIYVLSLGPACLVANAYPSIRGALSAFYTPLAILAERILPLAEAIDWYLRLWGAR